MGKEVLATKSNKLLMDTLRKMFAEYQLENPGTTVLSFKANTGERVIYSPYKDIGDSLDEVLGVHREGEINLDIH